MVRNTASHDSRVLRCARVLRARGYEVVVVAVTSERERAPRATLQGIEVVRRGELGAGRRHADDAEPRAVDQHHEAGQRGHQEQPRQDARRGWQAASQAMAQRPAGTARVPRGSSPRPRPRLGGPAHPSLSSSLSGVEGPSPTRSIPSSMMRSTSSPKPIPASSACLGNMLVVVKPGIVFISET